MLNFPDSKLQWQSWRLIMALLMGLVLSIGSANLHNWDLAPATAQILRPEIVAEQVYQRFSDLPRANQYLSQETGAVVTDNTLIGRLVRYHQYVKSRPTRFRLDWQLTLADYLGVNETIKTERYPGAQTLTSNPLEADRQAIANLNRRQRSELVDILVSIYNPQAAKPPGSNADSPNNSESDSFSTPPKPRLSQPGDAQLLMP